MDSYVGVKVDALRYMVTKLSDKQMRLVLALASHINDIGVCWPNFRRIVELTGIDLATISFTVKQLIAANVVRILEASEKSIKQQGKTISL